MVMWLSPDRGATCISDSFPGLGAEKSTAMAVTFDRLSQSFAPCAFGVMVAVVTMWFYKYLLSELESFDAEMENLSLKLMHSLVFRSIQNWTPMVLTWRRPPTGGRNPAARSRAFWRTYGCSARHGSVSFSSPQHRASVGCLERLHFSVRSVARHARIVSC